MKLLDLQQTARYLEHAEIIQTVDVGHALIHIGKNIAGASFLLVNNAEEQSVLTEGM